MLWISGRRSTTVCEKEGGGGPRGERGAATRPEGGRRGRERDRKAFGPAATGDTMACKCTNEMDVRGEGSASTRTTRRNRPLSRDWLSRSLSKSHIGISVYLLPLKI